MPYRVVFTNGEQRELVVKADKVEYRPESKQMVFFDENDLPIAYVPSDRILYVKKVES